MRRIVFFMLIASAGANAALPPASRPVRTWEFLDAVGQQASILGQEDGTLEAYVYPLKLFSGMAFSFEVNDKIIPASGISRRVSYAAGATTIVFSGDEFRVAETITVPPHYPGGLIRLDIQAFNPVTIRFTLKPDFQLMWPASFGSAFAEWKAAEKLFVFGADGKPFRAVLGSPHLALKSAAYASNYGAQSQPEFSLGTVKGHAIRTLAFAASIKSLDEAVSAQSHLIEQPGRFEAEANEYFDHYLERTVSIEIPDKDLQNAYDRSRVSLVKGLVDNPFLGTGLVAGYGPSKGGYRPGFAWFFGRDSFWSSFALNSDGDWSSSRQAIEFISRFQREDGKIPHEISQTASQVAWSKDYPYEYASADATPLFIIAVRDYVQHSGDVKFAERLWPAVQKAMMFSQSTVDSNGFAKNFGVGHGWVEGGPLLPVRVEFYMAGCFVEAMRSFATLAKWTGHTQIANEYEKSAVAQQQKLDQLFWLQQANVYAFAIANDGKPVNQPSVLALVPEWWGLLPLERVQQTIKILADEDHASDWGMRILSSRAALYNPAGYHFGSVWPLFTGWASVGEYHAHQSAAAFANLKANSWLALDGAGGNTTEVLSGQTDSPLSTATPHQIWSAAMIISPILRGIFGLEANSVERRLTVRPHLPADWPEASINRLPIASGTLNLRLERNESMLTLTVENHGAGNLKLLFAPAYSPYTNVTAASFNQEPIKFSREDGRVDWHPVIEQQISNGTNTFVLHHDRWFGISAPNGPPYLAEPSSNLKILEELWQNQNRRLLLTLSGRAGQTYRLAITGSPNIAGIHGASQKENVLSVTMPSGTGYVHTQLVIDLH